jgi:HAD superfamily hydrolase (TIGR01490 family)
MTTSTAGDRDTRVTTRRAAFFDVDKTLLPGSSLYLFARGLYRRGFYDLRDIAAFAFGQLVFRLTGAEGRRGMEAAREQALAFIEGRRRDDLVQIGHDIVVEVIGPRIYPGMRRVIDDHHARGDRTYLVTAAPRELAEGIATYLGMDGALGTEAELVDGTYTGRLLGPVLHGPAKLDAVLRLANEQGFDLRTSSAYSDSVNDRPLLEGVGRPVAVNPDRYLRDLAAERGWPVQDFRRRRRLWLVWLPAGMAAGAGCGWSGCPPGWPPGSPPWRPRPPAAAWPGAAGRGPTAAGALALAWVGGWQATLAEHGRDLVLGQAAGGQGAAQAPGRLGRRGPAVAQRAVVVLALEQAVDEPLGVVPGHVVVDRRLEGRLVHPGLAVLEDVLQVLAQQAPAEEVVLLAVGAGDDHPEEAALLQRRPELGQVGQVVQERGTLLVVDGLGGRVVLRLEWVEGVGHGHSVDQVDANVSWHGTADAGRAVLDLHRTPLLASSMHLPRARRASGRVRSRIGTRTWYPPQGGTQRG